MEYTLICEDHIEGIFSGVYEAWAGKYNRQHLRLYAGDIQQQELFVEYVKVLSNAEWSRKVSNTIRRRFGEEVYETICYALWSNGEDKANAVYQMILYGIENHCGAQLQNHLTNPYIERVFRLRRTVWNEAHHYLGFVRFEELENGLLYAQIEPKNYVLEPLAQHFADRLPAENWLIFDKIRKLAVVHEAYGRWFVADEDSVYVLLQKRRGQKDEEYRIMWKNFCNAISIEARYNHKLQQQNLPLRFQKNMVQ